MRHTVSATPQKRAIRADHSGDAAWADLKLTLRLHVKRSVQLGRQPSAFAAGYKVQANHLSKSGLRHVAQADRAPRHRKHVLVRHIGLCNKRVPVMGTVEFRNQLQSIGMAIVDLLCCKNVAQTPRFGFVPIGLAELDHVISVRRRAGVGARIATGQRRDRTTDLIPI